ncbi:17-beta-hydroxysteroid dehydrogenase type 2 isoform X3 [Melospiza melodia melodia]|uniref:17-beta-hydroxysteroid dehydrogenase type 2 isoform X3 n=1 Tax=Melospiza melodia melodia TaxID=1914991 RepID=UPI002FCEC34D
MDAAASSPLGWLCAGATRLFGVTMARRSPLHRAKVLLCSLLPALLCVATLGAGQGLGVFVAMCLLCSVCLGDRDLLPVGDRAVLITGLWGVVNNAGILGFPADGELLPMSTYRHCMEVNFFGAVEVSKTFLPLLRKSQGRLVNMSSMAGGIPLPRYAAYGASKAALSMFSGVMRQELSKWGIKVMAIHPSGFRTGIEGTAEQWDRQEKELMENLPADTRQAYGEEYLLGLRDYLLHLPSHCAPDLSPVLGSVLHALLARRPQGLYTPGKGAYAPLCIFCCFPLWFYDFFISKVLSAGSVPRQLRTSGDEGKNL